MRIKNDFEVGIKNDFEVWIKNDFLVRIAKRLLRLMQWRSMLKCIHHVIGQYKSDIHTIHTTIFIV